MSTAKQLTFEEFTRLAEEADVSWTLRRRAGWYVSGEHSIDENGRPLDLEEIPEEHRTPIERGYTIEVAQRGYVDEAGDEIVYPTLMDALLAGLQILEAETEAT